MPTPYSPGGGSVDAWRGHLGAVEFVGDLDQDAGAVAHQLVGADGAAVVEVLEDLQALLDDRVRFLARDVRDEADAAGVVLARGSYSPPAAAAAMSVIEVGCPWAALLMANPSSALENPKTKPALRHAANPLNRGQYVLYAIALSWCDI